MVAARSPRIPRRATCASEACPWCCGAEPRRRSSPTSPQRKRGGAVFWNRRYGGAEREVDTALKSGAARRAGSRSRRSPPRCCSSRGPCRRVPARRSRSSRRSGGRAGRCPAPRAPLPEPREIPGPRLDPLRATPSTTGTCCRRSRTGRVAFARRGTPASRPRALGCGSSWPTTSTTTTARGDEPSAGATSRLSPRLRWGELSPHTVWHEAVASGRKSGPVPLRAGLARVRRARALPPPRPRDEEPPAGVRRVPVAPSAPGAAAGVAAGAHRHPARGCRACASCGTPA